MDSDLELELLARDDGVQIFGEHEVRTAPLITRDATTLSGKFAERGMLGSVLSVHASDIPFKTKDPRIYMNLDAPSSGLVCGVQGSGKSHTVSCIMESALISDRRVGNLPAPLATVVFHYDEENGGRPCEAAYLSQLKGNLDRAVSEVVVLVSPSNLNTRKGVYKDLQFVHVEPLKIAEKDLNAARMLSMMGADDIERMPLYLHTALSILREMGSDNFSYPAFRERLNESEFNQKQLAMLQLRLDLLDSFLRGDGGDVSFFLKPGRLVIIDLSDPFVDATTAAMLFDICLGLFIEWKTPTGKLIVLDEAHKYLTNSDANQFTKTICSIIRQQRHLAARVIVSTQEPTVVPSSILDLLSWVICHRFSSPSWVKHLSHHLCVDQVEDRDQLSETSDDWGRRVMTLRTGEALLYSPASLFVSTCGRLASLSTGYAIIKSRPRITTDGGASLLATGVMDLDDRIEDTGITVYNRSLQGIPSPSTSFSLEPLSASPRKNVEKVAPLHTNATCDANSSPETVASSSTAGRRSYELVLAAIHRLESITHRRTIPIGALMRDTTMLDALSSTGYSDFSSFLLDAQKDGLLVKSFDQKGQFLELTPSFTSLQPNQLQVPHSPTPKPSSLSTVTGTKHISPPTLANSASNINGAIVATIPSSTQPSMALSSNPSSAPSITPITAGAVKSHPQPESNTGAGTKPAPASVAKYRPLIAAMNSILDKFGSQQVDLGNIAPEVRKVDPKAYVGKFKPYMEAAQQAGIVTLMPKKDIIMVSLNPSLCWKRFDPLVAAIKSLEPVPGNWINFSSVSIALAKAIPGGYETLGFRKFRLLVDAAVEAGLLKVDTMMGSGSERLCRAC